MKIKINTTKISVLLTACFAIVLSFVSCSEDEEVDTEKPIINVEYAKAFPSYCDTIYFGEAFNFKASYSDNVELGGYSIDIHNDFDHHIHAYKIEKCHLAPVKKPVNPFSKIEGYEIPTGVKEHEVNLSISIPASNDSGQFDEGDYCFHIYLTDKEGWSTPFAVSIKMMHRTVQ